MKVLLCLLPCLLAVNAIKLPYNAGSDMDSLLEKSQKRQQKPRAAISTHQLAEYESYNSKFNEVAVAYARGFQAGLQKAEVIRAARSFPVAAEPDQFLIPVDKPHSVESRSIIPQPPSPSALATLKNILERKRRDHQPYHGQNLDRAGVSRAVFNWDGKAKKEVIVPKPKPAAPMPAPVPAFQAPVAPVPNPFETKSAQMWAAYAQAQNRQVIPQQPQPQQQQMMFPNFAPNPWAGLVAPQVPKVEAKPAQEGASARAKKSSMSEEDVAALNFAARHRNVYFDSAGGDPYTGGQILSRQAMIYKKH